MAVRYTPLGGRETYLSDLERYNTDAAMRAADVRSALSRHMENLRRQDSAAYANAIGAIAQSQAAQSEAAANRRLQYDLGMERIGLQREGIVTQQQMAEAERAAAAQRAADQLAMQERGFGLKEAELEQRGRLEEMALQTKAGDRQAQREFRERQLGMQEAQLAREDAWRRMQHEEAKAREAREPLERIAGAILTDPNASPQERQAALEVSLNKSDELPEGMFEETPLQVETKLRTFADPLIAEWDQKFLKFWSRDEAAFGSDPSWGEARQLADSFLEIGRKLVAEGFPKDVVSHMLVRKFMDATSSDRSSGLGDANMIERIKRYLWPKLERGDW